VRYIGEVGEEKLDLYARAAAPLMPIRWAEPFGLVMTEAMACGTPVIAFPEGSAPKLVVDGETGSWSTTSVRWRTRWGACTR
jgi:glycosyltransferase involved in cell wall biosynthesis